MTELPKEVWAMRLPNGKLLPPIDDDGTDAFMAWPNRTEACAGLEHQRQWLEDTEVEIVRLFPA